MPTFSPTSALVSVVFPALGRPTRQAKPLRYGWRSGGVTPASPPPGPDAPALPAPGRPKGPGKIGDVAGRGRRGDGGEPLAVRAARDRQKHLTQVTSYGFFVRRGPKRSVTVTPAPLRYWQYDAPRAFVVALVALAIAAWLGYLGARDGADAVRGEIPLAAVLGVLVLVGSTGRFTVSDTGLSTDIAGLRQTSSFGVVPLALVREVVHGSAPSGWPRARRRGGWWPGRARVSVRHLAADGERERAFTIWVRDPAAFSAALNHPTT